MLEANPTLTAGDVRDLLEQTAREDNDTGALPSEGDWVWGHGKVTASQAVLAAISGVSSGPTSATPSAAEPLVFQPNPAGDHVWVSGFEEGLFHWELHGLQGQLVKQGNAEGPFLIQLDGLPQGMYVLQLQDRTRGLMQRGRVLKTQ
jgi:hypothetical protein